MVVSKEWIDEHQKVAVVAKDNDEKRVMEAVITDQEVAILCDVLEGWGANLNADKRKVLGQLIAKGFVVPADQESPAKYKLTGKAQQLLAERGVGLSGG